MTTLRNDTPVPTAEITDPLVRRRIDEAQGQGGNAFLLALAAWQRGLEVSFHFSFAASPRFGHLSTNGVHGELMSLRDGNRRHEFFRLLGDLTSQEASAACEVKPETRRRWRAAGVAIAPGVVATPGQGEAGANKLLEHYPGARYVLKPTAGSLGQGVQRNLDAAAVRLALREASEPRLLEVAIPGKELRVHVVGDRVVAAMVRRPASVVGDGRQTLEALIRRKEVARRRHSVYGISPEMLNAYTRQFLQARGLRLEDVPLSGERVFISDIPAYLEGADQIEGLPSLSALIRAQCVAACRALALPNAGLDLIVTRDAAGAPKAVFLEANQNPYIRHLSCPMPGVYEGCGNRVAEAIVDHYFPGSRTRRRHTRASFDFTAVCRTLANGSAARLTLPTLAPDWEHRRLAIPATQVNEAQLQYLHQRAREQGWHAQLLRSDVGDVTLDMVGPEVRLSELADRLHQTP